MSFTRAAGGISASPLSSLSAVIIDTETTGLNVKQDRIIEIAGVRMKSGVVQGKSHFQQLINPGQPIPASSTAIHGLRDKDVKSAPSLENVLPEFRTWLSDALWIGFSIDYDVSIFAAEHDRLGVAFTPPRVLDVHDLVEFLRPNLPDYSLETIAAWLKVSVEGRHRALADAEMTAHIFTCLIPLLEKAGVKTLAQAERISNRQLSELGPTEEPKRQIDSFAYRHRVAEVMTSPAWIEKPTAQLKSIVSTMQKKGFSSVFVADGNKTGVATQNAILAQIADRPTTWEKLPLAKASEYPLPLVAEDEMLYRALDLFLESETKHIGVADPSGKIIGAISPKDLIGQRAADDISFDRDIRDAISREELGRVWPKLIEVTRSLVAENVEPRQVAKFVSRELQALTARACELAEIELENEGFGKPPVEYAMMVLGSGGRGESMLAMDQDNAVIYANSRKNKANDAYFEKLGGKVADILDAVGVSYCKGGIMASNAKWRRTDKEWAREVGEWITRSQPEDILQCDIFFDAHGVHGNVDMVRKLQVDALAQAQNARLFLKAMSMNASKFRSPLGMFNRLRSVEGRVDLKIGGIMPIFSAARVLALSCGFAGRATPDRLSAVKERSDIDPQLIENLDAAHKIFITRILAQQLDDLRAGIKLSNTVELRKLSDSQKSNLIWALKQSAEIPTILGVPPS